MKAKATTLLLFALILSANATTIDTINLWIQEDGTVFIEEKLTLTQSTYHINLPPGIRDLAITSGRGTLKQNTTQSNQYTKTSFSLRKTLREGEEETVWIKYWTPTLTSKRSGLWHMSFNTQATPRKTIVELNFPPGSQIISLEPTSLLRTPAESALILYPAEKDFQFNTTYQYAQTPTTINPTQNDTTPQTNGPFMDSSTPLILIAAPIAVLLAVIAYLLYRRNQQTSDLTYSAQDGINEPLISQGNASLELSQEHGYKGRVKDDVSNMLDEKEKKIVHLLENTDEEETTQAYIYKTTGIPKSTLSEKLKQLEKRKIIYRSREGRTNWIKLQEWVIE